MKNIKTILILLTLVIASCSANNADLSHKLINASSIDEVITISKRIEKEGKDALPIFINIIKKLINNEHKLTNYGKINICLNSLHNLAQNGIYSNEEGQALIGVIKKQRLITDTLKTAEILKIVTGVDVGYDEAFVNSYTENDEGKRIKMIEKWEHSLS